ncbi:hypothetical protein M3Y94_00434000 [Aphelenchoides besseyi]|nr:hypothetical protein M3Y94_00434000 [Aphelenchoides besseyi]
MRVHQYVVCFVFLLFCNSTAHTKPKRNESVVDDELLGFVFTAEPSDSVLENSPIRFDCSYSINRTDAKIDVEWRKDGNLLLIGNNSRVKLSNNSLVINESSASDEGVYECVVTVRRKSFSWVFVSKRSRLVAPKFLRFAQQPISQKVFVNSAVGFRCTVETNTRLFNLTESAFTVEWYHNSHLITDGSEGLNILPVSHTLEILNAQKSHSGLYQCKCVARKGAQIESIASQTATLDVLEGFAPNGAISFALQPRAQSVNEGDDVIVECLVNSNQKTKVSFHKDGHSIDESKYQRVGILRSSILISNITRKEAGLYVCRAENSEDQTDASALISVHVPPTITKRPVDVIAKETDDVEFECSATGQPTPRVIWTKNGEVITPSEYFVIAEDRLKIYGLIRDDQGIYECSVNEGVHESAHAFAQLVVNQAALTQALIADNQDQHILPAPVGLQAQSVGSKSLRLKWNPPFGLTDDVTYKIRYREDNSNSSEMITTSPTASVTIMSLKADTNYVIRVEAVHENKSGLPSSDLHVKTKTNEAIALKVSNLKVTMIGSDGAQIDWESPSVSDSNSLRFKVFYRRIDGEAEDEEIQAVVAKTTYTLHSLKKNSEYSVRVQVVDSEGLGQTSDPLRFRTYPDIPGTSPSNVRADSTEPGTLRIRWEPPSEPNGQLSSYKIRYKLKTKGSRSHLATADTNSLEHLITSLEHGVYQVRIAAQNQNGTGPYSEWITAEVLPEEQTDEVAPAPSELRVFAEHDSVHVSWLPPREHGIVVRGYAVGWGVYVPDREKAAVGADVREYTITGLKPNREYVISVRAITRAGDGFPIYETVKTSAYSRPHQTSNSKDVDGLLKVPDALTAVVGLQAESVSSTSIRLSWVDSNNIFNPTYTVRYSHSGGAEQYQYVNTSDTEILIDGLQPNTQYEFAVRLFDLWSMSALSRTQPSAPSSAPRDLTVVPSSSIERTDPTSVTLNWQPPKYANGEIEEYIVLYSDRLDLPDRDWVVDSVKGDRLSMKLFALMPKTTYYFKVQARNVKGYGPLSPVVTFAPDQLGYVPSNDERVKLLDSEGKSPDLIEMTIEFVKTHAVYVAGVCSLIILLLVILLVVVCLRRGSSGKPLQRHHYIAGRKLSSPGRDSIGRTPQNDCWIAHTSNRVELMTTAPVNAPHELKQFSTHETPPPRYQTLQGNNSSISRNYHNSTISLEGRQRTPQIVYTGTNRQHINKIDMSSDRGSSFGGSNTILQLGHTPPLPSTGNDGMEPGYQTVRHANPLRSFVHNMNVPPPPESTADIRSVFQSQSPIQHETRFARPMVIASPNNTRASTSRPAEFLGQRSTASGIAPIGLAQAQPRVNVASVYSPYQSTLGSREDLRKESSSDLTSKLKDERPISQISTEDFNAGQLDNIIDTLQKMQQQFDS